MADYFQGFGNKSPRAFQSVENRNSLNDSRTVLRKKELQKVNK